MQDATRFINGPCPPHLAKSFPESLPLVAGADLPEGFLYIDPNYSTNRAGGRVDYCVPNDLLPNIGYSTSEPYNAQAGPSMFDASLKIGRNQDGVLTSPGGYCSCRANVGIGAGSWYFEIKIVKSKESTNDAHVRVGVSRREFNLETSVGCDAYSYGLQDKGRKVYAARPRDFMEGFQTGDVLGFQVVIPRERPENVPYKARRDRLPFGKNDHIWWDVLDYAATDEMNDLLLPRVGAEFYPSPREAIPGSYIRLFKNGVDKGIMFEDLREFLPPFSQFSKEQGISSFNDGRLGYYPTISCYRGGQAKFFLNQSELQYPVPEGSRPLGERYVEQVADDVVLDVLDQVQFEEVDKSLPPEKLIRLEFRWLDDPALKHMDTAALPKPERRRKRPKKDDRSPTPQDGLLKNEPQSSDNIPDHPMQHDEPVPKMEVNSPLVPQVNDVMTNSLTQSEPVAPKIEPNSPLSYPSNNVMEHPMVPHEEAPVAPKVEADSPFEQTTSIESVMPQNTKDAERAPDHSRIAPAMPMEPSQEVHAQTPFIQVPAPPQTNVSELPVPPGPAATAHPSAPLAEHAPAPEEGLRNGQPSQETTPSTATEEGKSSLRDILN